MTILTYILSILLLAEITFERSDFEDILEKYIFAKTKLNKENLIIDYLNIPERVTVKSSSAQLKVSEISGKYLSGNVTIPVNIVDNDKILKKVFVSVKIRVFDSVFVARSDINQYQTFSEENVEKKWSEITGLDQPVRLESEINGKRSNRYITEGKTILINLIENLPIIKNGQQITIISRINSVVISATGLAREDGRKGDIINVENKASGAKLKAKVIDKDKVEIIR